MDNQTEIDTDLQDLVVCPYCGEEDEYNWKHNGQDDDDVEHVEQDCWSCGQKFKLTIEFSVQYTVHYTTRKIERNG